MRISGDPVAHVHALLSRSLDPPGWQKRPSAGCWTKVLSRRGPPAWHHRCAMMELRYPAVRPRADAIDALVTGGTGFVGANVARELVAAGATVRVLARPRADRRALQGLRVEIADGDLLNPGSVRRALDGVQTVYHVAADYRLWTPEPAALYRTNVDGTRVVLEAAGEAGVSRVVHTSSVAALGVPTDGEPGTEDTPVTLGDMSGPLRAVQVPRRAARARLRAPRSAGRRGESDGAARALGRQADADRTDDPGLHARPDEGHRRDRAQRRPRARRGPRPPAGGRARQAGRALHPRSSESSTRPSSSRCWPSSPGAGRRACGCRYAMAWLAAACCEGLAQRDAPAAGGDADGGPHGAQAHVLQSRSGRARAGAAADGRAGGAGRRHRLVQGPRLCRAPIRQELRRP